MTEADKKLYDKAEELFCQNCKLRTEQCLFAYRKVNGIEDCHKSCGCEEVPAWIDGYKEGLKAKINITTISDCPIKDKWHKADVPTNPINKVVLGYIKHYNSKLFCLVGWNGKWWYDAGTYNDEVKLIAWCEIPQYTEE